MPVFPNKKAENAHLYPLRSLDKQLKEFLPVIERITDLTEERDLQRAVEDMRETLRQIRRYTCANLFHVLQSSGQIEDREIRNIVFAINLIKCTGCTDAQIINLLCTTDERGHIPLFVHCLPL